jgi:hypothetical protein
MLIVGGKEGVRRESGEVRALLLACEEEIRVLAMREVILP